MKNAVILCLLAVTIVSAQQKQRVAVLPSVGDLDPQGLILLTDKVREIATKNLPIENFNILKQDVITKMIGEEELYKSCKEGVCIGDLAKRTNANYGARCDVIRYGNGLVLKFELYSVNEDAIFETFTDYNVKDFQGMLMALEVRLPDAFKKMISARNAEMAQAKPIAPPAPLVPAAPMPPPAAIVQPKPTSTPAPIPEPKPQQRPAVTVNLSEPSYIQIIKDYEKHGKNSKMDRASVAQAYFMMGEIYYRKFEEIKLDAKNKKEMAARVKTKTKALEDPAKYFAKAIEIGGDEWTTRAVYMIGRGFYDMADAVANQPLFGNEMEKMAGKIKVFSSLDKYYEKAIEYFSQNIAWAKKHNLKGEYIEMSMQAIMEMAYKRGEILEEVGLLFKNSPVPKGLSGKEKEYYLQQLEFKYREALDAAIPVYENGMKLAKETGIANSPWIDKLREKLAKHKPNSVWKDVQITEWKPAERVK